MDFYVAYKYKDHENSKGECKDCNKKRNNIWKKNNPKKRKDHVNKSYRKNKCLGRYGIDINDYNELLSKQNSCCANCGRNQIEFTRALAVDHNHKTGKIRGLLCNGCNTALGLLKENEQYIINLLEYLRKSNA